MYPVSEADPTDAEFVQLYGKMAQTLAVAGVVGQSPSALLSIQLPGVVIEPGLDPENPETQYYVSNFLNVALECNYVATHKAALTSDVYKLILDGKETPLVELAPEQKERLRAAERYLFEDGQPSKAFAAYQTHAMAYYAAQDQLSEAEATEQNGGPQVPEAYRLAVKAANEAWLRDGHKDEVQTELAVVSQLQARDPYRYWQRLADDFRKYTSQLPNGSEFQLVDSLPRYQDWFRDEQWTSFRFDEKDYERQRRSGGTGMRGGDGCCSCNGGGLGPRSHSLDQQGDADWRDATCVLAAQGAPPGTAPRLGVSGGDLALSCAIKRVVILRPWMDTAVFSSRLWRWSPSSIGRGIVLSSGGSVAGNRIATGALPVLPTTALIAKDIEVTTSSPELLHWAQAKRAAGQTLRYGPFLLDSVKPVTTGQRLANGRPAVAALLGAPQMFGYISTIHALCPNPDLTLPWPVTSAGSAHSTSESRAALRGTPP